MTAPRTRSRIGRASRAKGAQFEVAVANAVRPWWPDVRRSRDNGSATTSDTGDLAGTHSELYWSLKNVAAARTEPPGLLASWLHEAVLKGACRLPLVVVKRHGHADPLSSWCWLRISDVAALLGADGGRAFLAGHFPVRMELRHALDLLVAAGYAQRPNPKEK